MSRILVIGCVSQDKIHLEQVSKTINTVGGAAYYTALAALAAGSSVTILAPRPKITPDRLFDLPLSLKWIGPQVPEEEMPALEIRHHGNDRATLCGASWGAEQSLTVDFLPADLDQFSVIHIAALSSANRQLEFLEAIKTRSMTLVSIGTYAKLAYGETDLVRKLILNADFVFMNENEAKALFDPRSFPLSPRQKQIICVTKGRNGASVYSVSNQLDLAAAGVEELDPTGAGDTFAGTLLAALTQGKTLIESAELAIERSALVVTAAGPSAVLKLLEV